MTSNAKKGKSAVLEFGTQTKGKCYVIWRQLKTTDQGAVNLWTVDVKHSCRENNRDICETGFRGWVNFASNVDCERRSVDVLRRAWAIELVEESRVISSRVDGLQILSNFWLIILIFWGDYQAFCHQSKDQLLKSLRIPHALYFKTVYA